MAKKAKAKAKALVPEIIVDEEGYETDGMFRWSNERIPATFDNLRQRLEEIYSDQTKSASDRIAEIRDHLTQRIVPYVDGPLTLKASKKFHGCAITHLNLTGASGLYAIQRDVPKKGFVADALDALNELDQLSKLIDKRPDMVHRIVRSAVYVGMMLVQSDLREVFAPEVLSSRKRRTASAKGGKTRLKWTPQVAEWARTIFAEEKRRRVSDSAAYNRTAVRLLKEHDFEISAKTVMRHLSTNA